MSLIASSGELDGLKNQTLLAEDILSFIYFIKYLLSTRCVSGPVLAVRNAVMKTAYPQGMYALERNTITTNLVFRFLG